MSLPPPIGADVDGRLITGGRAFRGLYIDRAGSIGRNEYVRAVSRSRSV